MLEKANKLAGLPITVPVASNVVMSSSHRAFETLQTQPRDLQEIGSVEQEVALTDELITMLHASVPASLLA